MQSPPRSTGVNDASSLISLSGGHAEKLRTIVAYREGKRVDVEIQSNDGVRFKAHCLVLAAGSEYFDALYTKYSPDAPHALTEWFLSTEMLNACLEWIYTGTCVVANSEALRVLHEAARYLQITPLVQAANRAMRVSTAADELALERVGPASPFSASAEAPVTSFTYRRRRPMHPGRLHAFLQTSFPPSVLRSTGPGERPQAERIC